MVWNVGSCTRAEVASLPGCNSPKRPCSDAPWGRRGLELTFYCCINRSPHAVVTVPTSSSLPEEVPIPGISVGSFEHSSLPDFTFLPHISQLAPLTLLGSNYFELLSLVVLSKASQLVFIKNIKSLSFCIYELLIFGMLIRWTVITSPARGIRFGSERVAASEQTAHRERTAPRERAGATETGAGGVCRGGWEHWVREGQVRGAVRHFYGAVQHRCPWCGTPAFTSSCVCLEVCAQ